MSRVSQRPVFVASIGSAERVPELVAHLVRSGLDVVVDRDQVDPGNVLEKAGAFVLALGRGASADQQPYAVEQRLASGSLVVVLMNHTATSESLSGLRPFDLSDWSGGRHPEIHRLVATLLALSSSGLRPSYESLSDWAVQNTEEAITETRELTGKVVQLGELLIGDDRARADIVAVLDEVGDTYKAVNDAIVEYAAAGGRTGVLNRLSYHKLARTDLMERIHNGRGSCGRIETLYKRRGGLRAAILDNSPSAITAADEAFGRLSASDLTLFDRMEQLGKELTDEAIAVENLLMGGQDDFAGARVAEGWQRLRPLEDLLAETRGELQTQQNKLGYVKTVPASTEGITVSIKSISIAGNLYNSAVIAADTIQNSVVHVTSAPVSDDLKKTLLELHQAVATLTTALPEDEAARAAQDLDELAREATSPTPRKAFWRRAVDGLASVAKTVGEVGGPVVDLVGRVAALLAG